jgi:hypothetical protein
VSPGLRPRAAAARRVLGDRRRRIEHAARHVRGRPGAPDGVFNLDLHISVVADVRDVLERHGVPLTDWSISGHTWVWNRDREPVAVVNERTATGLSPRSAARFRRVYGRYLRSFRGYVSTHTPAFSLLYEGLDRPTLAVCSTRYEWPFTFDRAGWTWLDEHLAAGVAEGWLSLVANNRADAGYVENYAGILPPHVPSACAYVGERYRGELPTTIVWSKPDDFAAEIAGARTGPALSLRTALGKRFAWRDLYAHRAIVFVPYNVSVMSLFEHYTACMPIYVPERAFLKQLMRERPETVLSQLSYAQIAGRSATPRTRGALDLNDLRDEQVLDWYLDRADFYDSEWMPSVRTFESWAHLDHLLATDDHAAISEQMARDNVERLARIDAAWEALPWLAAVRGEPL